MKNIVGIILFFFLYKISFSQSDSLKYGLKGKIIRSIGGSPTNSSELYAGLKGKKLNTGTIHKSTDFGKTWKPLNNGSSISPYTSDIQAIAVASDLTNTIYAGTWKDGLYKSKDQGKTWKRDVNFPSSDIRSIKTGIQNPLLVYAATSSFGVIKSIDGGSTWIRCTPEVINTSFQFAWSIELDTKNDRIVYAQTYSKGVWKSIDQGNTWKQVLDTKGKTCWDMKISEDSKNIWVATSKSGANLSAIYHSKDGGNNWKELPNTPQIGLSQINMIDNKTLIIGSWKQGVFILKNDKWIKIDSVDFDTISEIITDKNQIVIGSWGNGIYRVAID